MIVNEKEFDETIASAREDVKTSNKLAHNSYGAGYDQGWLNALLLVNELGIRTTETDRLTNEAYERQLYT